MPDVVREDGFRYDEWNRRLCTARSSRTGELCRAAAIGGATVCRVHGGANRQVRRKAALRLAELVDPAIATLAREMTSADKSADRQRAANSILDRAGYGRTVQVDGDAARQILVQRLLAMRAEPVEPEELQPAPYAPPADAREGVSLSLAELNERAPTAPLVAPGGPPGPASTSTPSSAPAPAPDPEETP